MSLTFDLIDHFHVRRTIILVTVEMYLLCVACPIMLFAASPEFYEMCPAFTGFIAPLAALIPISVGTAIFTTRFGSKKDGAWISAFLVVTGLLISILAAGRATGAVGTAGIVISGFVAVHEDAKSIPADRASAIPRFKRRSYACFSIIVFFMLVYSILLDGVLTRCAVPDPSPFGIMGIDDATFLTALFLVPALVLVVLFIRESIARHLLLSGAQSWDDNKG